MGEPWTPDEQQQAEIDRQLAEFPWAHLPRRARLWRAVIATSLMWIVLAALAWGLVVAAGGEAWWLAVLLFALGALPCAYFWLSAALSPEAAARRRVRMTMSRADKASTGYWIG